MNGHNQNTALLPQGSGQKPREVRLSSKIVRLLWRQEQAKVKSIKTLFLKLWSWVSATFIPEVRQCLQNEIPKDH